MIKWLYENPFFAIWYSPIVCVALLPCLRNGLSSKFISKHGKFQGVSVISIIAIGSAIFITKPAFILAGASGISQEQLSNLSSILSMKKSQSSFPIGSKQGASSACNRLAKTTNKKRSFFTCRLPLQISL